MDVLALMSGIRDDLSASEFFRCLDGSGEKPFPITFPTVLLIYVEILDEGHWFFHSEKSTSSEVYVTVFPAAFPDEYIFPRER